MNGRRTGTATERPERHNNHDDPAFSGLLEIAAMRANKPLFHGDIPAWKKARFDRVFFENRFKRRNQQLVDLPRFRGQLS